MKKNAAPPQCSQENPQKNHYSIPAQRKRFSASFAGYRLIGLDAYLQRKAQVAQ